MWHWRELPPPPIVVDEANNYRRREVGEEAVAQLKSLPWRGNVRELKNVVERLRQLAPNGVDVHFENVGGDMLDAGLTVMKDFGSVVICGLISTYNSTAGDRIPGPYMFRNVIMRRLRIEGFVILDYADRYLGYQQQLAGWMLEGRLKYRLDVTPGIENAVDALKMLYTGANQGKVLVQVGDEAG